MGKKRKKDQQLKVTPIAAPATLKKQEDFKKTSLLEADEKKFQSWIGDDPDTDIYDFRGFYESEKEAGTLKENLADYIQDDPDYHFYSIGKDGKVLKSPKHPTYDKTVEGEEKLGREIYQDKEGVLRSREKGKDRETTFFGDLSEKVNPIVQVNPDSTKYDKRLREIHNTLLSSGIKVPKDFQTFRIGLDKGDRLERVHRELLGLNAPVPQSQGKFREGIGFLRPDTHIAEPELTPKASSELTITDQSDSKNRDKSRMRRESNEENIEEFKDSLRNVDIEELKGIREEVKAVNKITGKVETIRDLAKKKDINNETVKRNAIEAVYKEKTLKEFYGTREPISAEPEAVNSEYMEYLKKYDPENHWLKLEGKKMTVDEKHDFFKEATETKLIPTYLSYKETQTPELKSKFSELNNISQRYELLINNFERASAIVTAKGPNIYPEEYNRYVAKVAEWKEEAESLRIKAEEIEIDPVISAYEDARLAHQMNIASAKESEKTYYEENPEYIKKIARRTALDVASDAQLGIAGDAVISSGLRMIQGILTAVRYADVFSGDKYTAFDRFSDLASGAIDPLVNEIYGSPVEGGMFEYEVGVQQNNEDFIVRTDKDGKALDVVDAQKNKIDKNKKESILAAYEDLEKTPLGKRGVEGEAFQYGAVKAVTDMALIITGASAFTKVFSAAKLGPSVSQFMGLTTSGFVFEHNDLYNQGIDAGLSTDEASKFAFRTGMFIAMLENVNPQKYLMGSEGKKALATRYIKTLVKDRSQKSAFREMIKFATKEIGQENIQEITQTFAQKFGEFVAYKRYNAEAMLPEVTFDELAETVIMTTIASGLMAGGNFSNINNDPSRLETEALYELTNLKNSKVTSMLAKMKAKGTITAEQENNIRTLVNEARAAKSKIPKGKYGGQIYASLLALMVEKGRLQEKMKNVDEQFKPEYEADIAKVDAKIAETLGRPLVKEDKVESKPAEEKSEVDKKVEKTVNEFRSTEVTEDTEKYEAIIDSSVEETVGKAKESKLFGEATEEDLTKQLPRVKNKVQQYIDGEISAEELLEYSKVSTEGLTAEELLEKADQLTELFFKKKETEIVKEEPAKEERPTVENATYIGTEEGLDTYNTEVDGKNFTFSVSEGSTEAQIVKVRDKTIKAQQEKPSDIEASVEKAKKEGLLKEPKPVDEGKIGKALTSARKINKEPQRSRKKASIEKIRQAISEVNEEIGSERFAVARNEQTGTITITDNQTGKTIRSAKGLGETIKIAKEESKKENVEEFNKKPNQEKQTEISNESLAGRVIGKITKVGRSVSFKTKDGRLLKMWRMQDKKFDPDADYEIKMVLPTKEGDTVTAGDGTKLKVVKVPGGLAFSIKGKIYGPVAEVHKVGGGYIGNLAVTDYGITSSQLSPETKTVEEYMASAVTEKDAKYHVNKAADHLHDAFSHFRGKQGIMPEDPSYSGMDIGKVIDSVLKAAYEIIIAGAKSLSEIQFKLKQGVISSDATMSEKNQMLSIIDRHMKQIDNLRKYHELETIVSDNNYSDAMQKVQSIRNSFSELFDAMRKRGIEDPERMLYDISQTHPFELADEKAYEKWKEEVSKKYKFAPTMFELFDEDGIGINFDKAISVFNFYGNIKVYGHKMLTIDKDGKYVFIDVNNKNDVIKMANKARRSLTDFVYQHPDGKYEKDPNKALMLRFKEYESERRKVKKHADQFELDLQFLSDITGLAKETWRNYFVEQTNETVIYDMKTGKKLVYANAEEMFSDNDGYFPEGYSWKPKGAQITKFSIIGSLHAEMNSKLSLTTSSKGLIDFFIEREGKDAWTNIAKLATAQSDEMGFDYTTPENKRGVALIQNSNLSTAAETIRDQNLPGNHVVAYYKGTGENMEIVYLTGAKNMNSKKGIKAGKMSVKDIMITQFMLFFDTKGQTDKKGKPVYLQHLGQFGDKKQLTFARVPKMEYNDKAKAWIEKNYTSEEFEKSVQLHWTGMFSGSNPLSKQEAYNNVTKQKDAIREMLYNYLRNRKALDEIVYGKPEEYSSITEMYKRAGSTNSSGVKINQFVKGGVGDRQGTGENKGKAVFRHITIGEKIMETLGLDMETFDGITLMSGKNAGRIQVSLGELFAKKSIYEKLITLKALYSSVKDGVRGLTKSNIINIEVLASVLKDDSTYQRLKSFMDSNDIDVLSFESSTKKLEHQVKGKPTSTKKGALELFDNKGELQDISKAQIGEYIHERPYDNFFVQQDLRNETVIKFEKQPIQYVANILNLNSSSDFTRRWNIIQNRMMKQYMKEFGKITNQEQKRAWLLDKITFRSNPDLHLLISTGADLDSPIVSKGIERALAAHINNTVIQRKVRRVSTIEVPGVDIPLQKMELLEDPETGESKVVLPHILVDIDGLRYAEKVKSLTDAIKKLTTPSGRMTYPDMFDNEGNLKSWEIYEENGEWYIPGEPVIVTRVPSDDKHSHQFARVKYQIKGAGNLIITDRESQLMAGADNDGDKRYLETISKNADGNPILDDPSTDALLNENIFDILNDYQDPNNFEQITNPIDTKAYDDIHSKLTEGRKEHKTYSADGYYESYEKNMVGNSMKGILTNLSSTFSYINKFGLRLKFRLNYTMNGKNHSFSKVAEDRFGLVKAHIGNLLNLAFDNANNPLIEDLLLNEHTANIFIGLLTTDSKIDQFETKEEQNKYILELIEDIAIFLKDSGAKDFTAQKREETSIDVGISQREKNKDSFKDLKKLAFVFEDFKKIKTFQALTNEAPLTASEMWNALISLKEVIDNKLQIFDVSPFLSSPMDSGNGELADEFKTVSNSLSIAMKTAFDRSIEFSDPGMFVLNRILSVFKKAEAKFTNRDFDLFSAAFNRYIVSRAFNVSEQLPKLEKRLAEEISKLELEDNSFINLIQVYSDKNIGILRNYRFADLPPLDIEKARIDFEELPQKLKDDLTYYALTKYGWSGNEMAGNFINIIGRDQMIKATKITGDETRRWLNDDIPDRMLNEAALHILRSTSRFSEMLNEDLKPTKQSGIIDPALNPTFPNDITQEDLEKAAHLEGETSEERMHSYLALEEEIGTGLKALLTEFNYLKTTNKDLKWKEFLLGKIHKSELKLNMTVKQRTDLWAEKIRSLKSSNWMNPDMMYMDITAPVRIIIDGVLESIARIVKSTGDISYAIQKAKSDARNSAAFQDLKPGEVFIFNSEIERIIQEEFSIFDSNGESLFSKDEETEILHTGGNIFHKRREKLMQEYLKTLFGIDLNKISLAQQATITQRGEHAIDSFLRDEKKVTQEEIDSMSLTEKLYYMINPNRINKESFELPEENKFGITQDELDEMPFKPLSPEQFGAIEDLVRKGNQLLFDRKYKAYVISFKKFLENMVEFEKLGEIGHDAKKIITIRTIINSLKAQPSELATAPLVNHLQSILVEQRMNELLHRENDPGYEGSRITTLILGLTKMNQKALLTKDYKASKSERKIIKYIKHRKDFGYNEPLLQLYAREFYEMQNKAVVETLELKAELKSLKNSIGEDIILAIQDTSNGYEFRTPSEMIDKYGPESKNPKPDLVRLIQVIYNINHQGNPVFSSRRMFNIEERVLVPGEYMKWFQALKKFGWSKAWRNLNIHRLMKPMEFDHVIIQRGTFTTLNSLKEKFINDFQSLIYDENNNLIGNQRKAYGFNVKQAIAVIESAKKKAEELYYEGFDADGNDIIKDQKPRTIGFKGRTNVHEFMRQHDIWADLDNNLSSLISAKYKYKVLPMAEMVAAMYNQNIDKKSLALEFMDEEIQKNIFNSNVDKDVKGLWKIPNIIMDLAALRWLGLNIPGAIGNFTAGIFADMQQHPGKTLRGATRLFSEIYDSGDSMSDEEKKVIFLNNVLKLNNILKSLHIATVIEDVVGEGAGAFMNKMRKTAFSPIEIVETLNQGLLVAGAMTKTEWDSLDKHGNTRPGHKEISDNRKSEIKILAQDVHGAYGSDKPAYNNYMVGRLIGMLRFPWMYRMFMNAYGGELTDFTGQYTIGYIRGAVNMMRIARYNSLSTAQRKTMYENAKKGLPIKLLGKNFNIPGFKIDSIEEGPVLASILGNSEGEKIGMDSIPREMRRSIGKSGRMAAFILLLTFLAPRVRRKNEELEEQYGSLSDMPEDVLGEYKKRRSFIKWLDKTTKDIAIPFSINSTFDSLGRLVVPLQYGVSSAKLFIDLANMMSPDIEVRAKARYDKATDIAKRGELKIWNDILNLAPVVGSPIITGRKFIREKLNLVQKEQEDYRIRLSIDKVALDLAIFKSVEENWDPTRYAEHYDQMLKENWDEIVAIWNAKQIISAPSQIVQNLKDGITAEQQARHDLIYEDVTAHRKLKVQRADLPEETKVEFLQKLDDIKDLTKYEAFDSIEKAKEKIQNSYRKDDDFEEPNK